MEDKLFYFPIDSSENIWKTVQQNYESNIDSEFYWKKDTSGTIVGLTGSISPSSEFTGSYELPKNTHKIYVTLIGGGGSGSLGEKRPKYSRVEDAMYRRKNGRNPDTSNNIIGSTSMSDREAYHEYVNVIPLPGCGGGGGSTIFRIPILLIQSQKTILNYKVGKGGDGIIQRENEPDFPKDQRVGKSGEDTTLIVEQKDNSNNLVKTYKIKAMGGGGAGVVGYTYSRKDIFEMDPNRFEYIYDWSFGAEHNIAEGAPMDINTGIPGRNRYYVRQSNDPTNQGYNQYEHIKRLAEPYTSLFKLPSFSLIAFHRELDYPIGANNPIDAAENRNEYIPYNLMTHGEDGILRNEYFKPQDQIRLKEFNNEPIYFGGKYNQILPNDPTYKTLVSSNGVKQFDRMMNYSSVLSGDVKYFNFLYEYAPDQFYKDDRAWIQVWDYNIAQLRGHPRYYLNIGQTINCKDGTSIYPKDAYIPFSGPEQSKMAIFTSGTQDIIIPKWSPQFQALYNKYGGPLKEIPQKKGSTGAFGGAGGGFLLFDEPSPSTYHGLRGGEPVYNVWKLPESGQGGKPYPKHIWNTINVKDLDASGLGGAYYYWGGKGYDEKDANSIGGDSKMTLHFIPGSGGGSLDYLHQNNILSRRRYSGGTVDFADILPQMTESTMTNLDGRVYEWFCSAYENLATGGKIKYQFRDPSNNQWISRLYMNDLYGKHKIQFTNKGETGPRDVNQLLKIFGAGGGGGKAFIYEPGDGQENPDEEPSDPGYGCGSGGACSLNLDGAAAINGVPRGSVDYYLRKMISYEQSQVYIIFHNSAYALIISSYISVITLVVAVGVVISYFTANIIPTLKAQVDAIKTAIKSGETLTSYYKFILILNDIYEAYKSLKKAVGKVFKKISKNIRAFFKYIFGGTSFDDGLRMVKEADEIAKVAAKKAAALQSKLLESIANGPWWKKVGWRLEQIISKIPSLLMGDLYEFSTAFTDKIVYNVKKGIFVVKNASKLVYAGGKFLTSSKDLAEIGAKLSNVAEGAVDLARAGDAISEGIQSATKSAQEAMENIGNKGEALRAFGQADNADNVIPEQLSKLYDDKADDIATKIVNKTQQNPTNVSDLDINLDNSLDNTFNAADRKEILKRIQAKLESFETQGLRLNDPLKTIDKKTYKQILNESIETQMKGLDELIANQDSASKAFSKELVKLDDFNPGGALDDAPVDNVNRAGSLDDSLKTMDTSQRQSFLKRLDEVRNLDDAGKLDIENFKKILEDPNNTIKYKFTTTAGEKTKKLEFYLTSINKFDPKQTFRLNEEIYKIFDNNPQLVRAFELDPVVRLEEAYMNMRLANVKNDLPKWVADNPDDFVSILKSDKDLGIFKELEPAEIQKLTEGVLPKLKQNKELLSEAITNPNRTFQRLNDVFQIGENEKLIRTQLKVDLLDSALKRLDELPIKYNTKDGLISNILSEFQPDELRDYIKIGGVDVTQKTFFQDINSYFKNQLTNVSEGTNVKFVVKDSAGRTIADYTNLFDDLNPSVQENLLKSLDAPNPAKESSLVDNGQNYVEVTQKTLNADNQANLKSLFDDAGKRDINVPSSLNDVDVNTNLFDQDSFATFRKDLLELTENYQASYLKSIESLKDAAGNINPDSLAMVNRIYEPLFEKLRNINLELEDILKIPDAQKVKIQSVAQGQNVIDQLKNTTKKYQIKLQGTEQLENSILQADNLDDPAKTKTKIDDAKKMIEDNKINAEKNAEAINAENKKIYDENLKKYNEETLPEWKKKYDQSTAEQQIEIEQLNKELEEIRKARNKDALKRAQNKKLIESIKKDYGLEFQKDIDLNLPKDKVIDKKSAFKRNPKKLIQFDNNVEYPELFIKVDDTGKKTNAVQPGELKLITPDKIPDKRFALNLQGRIQGLEYDLTPDESWIVKENDKINQIKRVESKLPVKPEPPKLPETIEPTWVDNMEIEVQYIERKFVIDNWQPQPLRPVTPDAPVKPPPIQVEKHIKVPATEINVKTIELPKGYVEKANPIVLIPTNDYEYIFTIIANPIEPSTKAPLGSAIKKARRNVLPKIPKDIELKAPEFKEWLEPNVPRPTSNIIDIPNPPFPPPIKLTYRITKALNDYFQTDTFTSLKPIRYQDICDNIVDINPEFLLRQSNNSNNFVDAIVEEILYSKPEPDDDLRLIAYEDVFRDIFEFPVIFEKKQIDNRMLEMLFEQRRRGISIDLVYLKKYINYDNLNILNKINYQYLFSEFKKVEDLLVNQISIIQNNFMIVV